MRLTRREKRLSFSVAVLLTVWAFYAVLVQPTMARLETLHRVIPEKAAVLNELKAKSGEYLALQEQFNTVRRRIASQPADFAMMGYLESRLDEASLAGKVVSMKRQTRRIDATYSESLIVIELKNITLKQLVSDFLTSLPTEKAILHIKQLDITKNPTSPDSLNATVHIANIAADPAAQ